ncbi:diguanylate cyclase [Parasphingorhabdus sp.]|uniref:diguanylate cyclase n=1 Tax=Parasphingorhabdus sp. TaxID=2709688 RepID=UPI003A8E9E3F
MSASALLTTGKAFDCSENKYDVDGPRVWVKIPFLAETLPGGTIEVQGDNNGLTTIEVHAVLDDGKILSSTFSEQEVAGHWRPKGTYGLAIPGTENPELRSRIKHVYIAIDDPKVISSISVIQLASKQKWDDLKLPLSAMFAVLCGMAIMPLIYNAFFYAALRYNFMLWHSVMICMIVAYTFSSSGLIFLIFPEISLTTKMLINYWTIAIGVAASGCFLLRFVEPGKIATWLQITLFLAAMLPVFVSASVLQLDGGYSMHARNYYHASFLPAFCIVFYTMGHALRRGSKAIWFQIAGWTPIVFFGLDRVARGMDLYIGWPMLDYGLYFALVMETIILALGVAHRILRLRQKHETTLNKQVELTLLADTDGLTKMSNRRSFEREFRRNQRDHQYSHLALFDIDFFKRVNDRYGHDVGDEVLRVVGRQLDATSHFAARIGGEEFTLLMRKDSRQNREKYRATELNKICETLIKTVHDQVPEIREPVTFSVGVASISGHTSLRNVMATADRRLYDAKNNGRNQIVWIDISRAKPGEPTGTAAA